MIGSASIPTQWSDLRKEEAGRKIAEMWNTPAERRFIMGRNVYSEKVAAAVEVAGFVDDFTSEIRYLDKPVMKLDQLPDDSFVIAVSGGRPLTVIKQLTTRGIAHVDYFALRQWSGLNLPDAVFNEGFRDQFAAASSAIDWLFERLADEESRSILVKLLSFRATYDISHLSGFAERQTEQYFEDFFDPAAKQPVFVDVGGFDGFTTAEFVKRAPNYRSVYVFEPDPTNRDRCEARLASCANINLIAAGAGRSNQTLRFASNGSGSAISPDGEIEIDIRKIDDVVADVPTFIKIDIEGGEAGAIAGAANLIARDRPVLAIAVYHRPSDMWTIPAQIDRIATGYRVYLRHYTESIYETVMYFVPTEG